MKHCVICQKELPTPLDEFGMVQALLCREHFYSCNSHIEELLREYCYDFHLPQVFAYLRKFYDADEMADGLKALLIDLETYEIDMIDVLS